MATYTLGQMLEIALGSAKPGFVDFEQLYSLLNAMLLHLGLRDLAVQANGEPLEGSERSIFSAAFLEELMRRLETNEKEIAELRALCQDLREEVVEMKAENSRLTEDMQRMQNDFGTTMENLRNQLMSAMMEMIKSSKKGSRDVDALSIQSQSRLFDDEDLIVIGNEITLVERPVSRMGDMPMSSKAKTQSKEKGLLEPGSLPVIEADDMGQGVGRSDMGRKRRSVQLIDPRQSDKGQTKDEETKRSISNAKTLSSDLDASSGMIGVGEMDEKMKRSISKAGALPSDLDGSQEMTKMGEMKDDETKMGISKAEGAPHEMTSTGRITDEEMRKRSWDGGFAASGMHPGAPGAEAPVYYVQSMRGQPAPQTSRGPRRSVAETSRRAQPSPPSSSGQLARAFKRHPCVRVPQQRDLPSYGAYSRRSPLYSGGKHTTTYNVQPMGPLLPDPNKPGVCELMGKDGLLYRGRDP